MSTSDYTSVAPPVCCVGLLSLVPRGADQADGGAMAAAQQTAMPQRIWRAPAVSIYWAEGARLAATEFAGTENARQTVADNIQVAGNPSDAYEG